MLFKNILVPLDGSALAERAIPHAIAVARLLNSNIVLLRVLDTETQSTAPSDPLRWQIRRADAELHLREVEARVCASLGEPAPEPEAARDDASVLASNAADLPAVPSPSAALVPAAGVAAGADVAAGAGIAAPGSVPAADGETECGRPRRVRRLLLEGRTAETIVDTCAGEDIDLLVLSTHGAGGLSRWSLSSVTQKVLNLAYLPVLIVRSYRVPEAEMAQVHYKRILVPLDGSRRAESALSAAEALAQAQEAELVLLSVIRPPELPDGGPFLGEFKEILDRLMTEVRRAYGAYLQEVAERLPVASEWHLVEENSIISALEDACRDRNIDLVVLCAHGQAARGVQPYGAVARYAIEDGTWPLLILQDISRVNTRPTAAEQASDSTRSR
jgi:nucleotide-binding universal stress UspA family protein